jgi:hypothetical protein
MGFFYDWFIKTTTLPIKKFNEPLAFVRSLSSPSRSRATRGQGADVWPNEAQVVERHGESERTLTVCVLCYAFSHERNGTQKNTARPRTCNRAERNRGRTFPLRKRTRFAGRTWHGGAGGGRPLAIRQRMAEPVSRIVPVTGEDKHDRTHASSNRLNELGHSSDSSDSSVEPFFFES